MSPDSDIKDMNPDSDLENHLEERPQEEGAPGPGARPEANQGPEEEERPYFDGLPQEEAWPEPDRRSIPAMRPPSARAHFLKAVIPSLLIVFLMILGALVFWRVSQAKKKNKDDESSDFVWRETAPSFSLALPQESTEQTP